MYDNEQNIIEMNKAGVRSFVVKGNLNELLTAIQTVHKGGFYLPDEIANVLQKFLNKSEPKEVIELTDSEKMMLEAISKGWTSKQIARVIHKSPRTIDKYRQEIYSKFGVESKEQLVVKAVRVGLL
jgi:DNA-binding NarL/FixJ family response regulator